MCCVYFWKNVFFGIHLHFFLCLYIRKTNSRIIVTQLSPFPCMVITEQRPFVFLSGKSCFWGWVPPSLFYSQPGGCPAVEKIIPQCGGVWGRGGAEPSLVVFLFLLLAAGQTSSRPRKVVTFGQDTYSRGVCAHFSNGINPSPLSWSLVFRFDYCWPDFLAIFCLFF